MAVIEIAKIQVRRGQELQTGIPRLDPGEFGWAQDTEHLYIGKRVVEGAPDDENSRILTERDLDNIFELVGNTVTQVVAYKYREDVSYVRPDNPITLQDKLDETVSIISYNVVPSFTPVDITADFQAAVDKIYKNATWDSYERLDSRRELLIPAGHYYVSAPIELPPYASLKGEGPELTKLTYIGTSGSMFKTIDAEENDFESGLMDDGVKRSREVSLSGMTLEFDSDNTSTNGLISVDNTLNTRIRNISFRTAIDTTATTSFGLTEYGVGVSIRGTGNGLGSGDTNLCENVLISDCRFDGLQTGVVATGTVLRPVIENSVFSNLQNGVIFATGTVFASIGPTGGLVTKNRFENIVKEGVIVGNNPEERASNIITSENSFYQVGNGHDLDDFTTTEQYPVIRFVSQGNKSINDSFSRKTQADSTNDPNFYYNELVKGHAAVNNAAVFTTTLVGGTITGITKIALPDHTLKSVMNYKIENYGLSRSGQALITTDWSGAISVMDTFDFVEGYHLGLDNLTALDGSGLKSDLGFVITSGSPITIAPGVQTFVVNSVGIYAVGTRVRASYTADSSQFMEGYIQSINTGTLTMNVFVDYTYGSGSYASWNIETLGDVLVVEANSATSMLATLVGYTPPNPPTWYVTGRDHFSNQVATILKVDQQGTNYVITTDSADAFDFKTYNTETYVVVKSEESSFSFSMDDNYLNKNYVILTGVNAGSNFTDAIIKYQIDTLT